MRKWRSDPTKPIGYLNIQIGLKGNVLHVKNNANLQSFIKAITKIMLVENTRATKVIYYLVFMGENNLSLKLYNFSRFLANRLYI